MLFRILLTLCLIAAVVAWTRRPRLAVTRKELRSTPRNTHLRVLDGQDKNGEYPFVIQLLVLDEHDEHGFHRACTGAMIAPEWTLTAAHCVLHLDEFYIWYGNFTKSPIETKLYSRVEKVFMHPSFRFIETKDCFNDNDISLLRVRKIDMKSYGRILSVDYRTMIGLPVTYVGRGETDALQSNRIRPLQVGEAVITPCELEIKLQKYQMCVTPKCSRRTHVAWYGDSGGPVIHDGMIVGELTSIKNSSSMVHIRYTAISPYIDWISDVTHSRE